MIGWKRGLVVSSTNSRDAEHFPIGRAKSPYAYISVRVRRPVPVASRTTRGSALPYHHRTPTGARAVLVRVGYEYDPRTVCRVTLVW